MPPTLDHPMHWVADFAAARAAYQRAGLTLFDTPFPPAPGARSATWWDGHGYLEVLDLINPDEARSSTSYGTMPSTILPAVDQALAHGGGVVNLVVTVDDPAASAEQMEARGITADTATVTLGRWPRTITLDFAWPVHGPAWRPLLLRYSLPRWVRRTAERLRRGRPPNLKLAEIAIETPDPPASADWLGAVLDQPANHHQQPELILGAHRLLLTPGAADQIATVRLHGPSAPSTTIAGLRIEPADKERQ